MKKVMVIVTVLVASAMVMIAMGARQGEGKLQKQCKKMYRTSGERAGCVLGAYSEQHKLKRTCNILTGCAVVPNTPQCLQKRIGAVIRELSERSHSRPFVSFSKQALQHMDSIVVSHPIHIVNACRAGRNMVRSSEKAKEKVLHYEQVSSPVSITP